MAEVCNLKTHNFSLAKGESYSLVINAKEDGQPLKNAIAIATFRKNNNDVVLKTYQQPIVDGQAVITITEEDSRDVFGRGFFYYDIWLSLGDAGNTNKPAVAGMMTITLLSKEL